MTSKTKCAKIYENHLISFISGTSYEHACTAELAGSGGGVSSASGGGVLHVNVEKLFELDGWMKANGINGDSGGGGASGGTVRAVGRHFEGELEISLNNKWSEAEVFLEVIQRKSY